MLKVRSPAKLILSGEHSVIYGQPALAMAVDYYTETIVNRHKRPIIKFKFLDLEYAKEHTLQALNKLRVKLYEDYCAFLSGNCSIREVLKKPFELLQYTVGHLIEKLNLQLPLGLEIQVNSNIPIGCGMGSSAAAIMSILHAVAYLFKLDIGPKKILTIGQDAENLQHGISSGLDIQLAAFGGSIKFQKNKKTKAREIPQVPLYVVNTGTPISSTGVCVATVAKHFKTNKNLAFEFGAVTNYLDQALAENNFNGIREAILENHRLLKRIGVVPNKVADFIDAIEREGGAAKTCGAGSIRGNNAGVVMILADHDFSHIAKRFGYDLRLVQADCYGTRVV